MANEKDLIQEDVLFSPEDIADVSTEVLFDNSNGNIEPLSAYEESGIEELLPINEEVVEEVLFASEEPQIEELLPINEEISEEVLFSNAEPQIEELSLEPLNETYLSEESLNFTEPTRPTSIDEEVLFSDSDEKSVDLSEVDNNLNVISDELTALSNEAVKVKSDYVEKNFAQKILESEGEILSRYDELKNYILLYKGVKSRVSNDFDSFNMGRTQLFKLGYSTKSLKLYLNLEFDKVETRLKCKDVSHKKAYAEVPVFLRIKSNRAMKNAKYLIDKVAERFELKENKRAVYVDSISILKEKAKTYNK